MRKVNACRYSSQSAVFLMSGSFRASSASGIHEVSSSSFAISVASRWSGLEPTPGDRSLRRRSRVLPKPPSPCPLRPPAFSR